MVAEMWEHGTLDRLFDMVKFDTLTPLSWLNSCKLSFAVFLKISSLPHLH
jgi:hypothetical protein